MRYFLRDLAGALVALLLAGCGKTTHGGEPSSALVERPHPEPFVPVACAATASTDGCVDDPSIALCPGAAGYDFLKVVLQADAATLSTPRPGQICVSGTIPDLGADKFAQLSLVFLLSRRDLTGTCMLSAFDPYAFGIAALSFEIDRIPDALVYLGFSAIQAPECPGDNGACTKDGIYDWVTPDRQQIVELSPGTIVAPRQPRTTLRSADPDRH
jgi:hypothetical protein